MEPLIRDTSRRAGHRPPRPTGGFAAGVMAAPGSTDHGPPTPPTKAPACGRVLLLCGPDPRPRDAKDRAAHPGPVPRATVRAVAAASFIALRLYPTSTHALAREQAARVAEGLESNRPISAGQGEWQVLYRASDISEAMAMCAADLDLLDPGWEEILDFEAIPSFPRLTPRPHRPTS